MDHDLHPSPVDYWEHRYGEAHRMWSGRVNAVLADIAATLEPGAALDLGCGEGADVIWLAEHGWTATGVDISATAIRRAQEAARAVGIPEARARFVAADLARFVDEGRYDLVAASFLHSPVELDRTAILRGAASRVASGGHLLITSHADFPPGSHAHGDTHRFLNPSEEIADLDLAPASWKTVIAETRPRRATLRDGRSVTLEDVVVLLRRA